MKSPDRDWRFPYGSYVDEALMRRVLASITITDPIKTAFAPRLGYDRDTGQLVIRITATAADGSGALIDVSVRKAVPPSNDPDYLVGFVRRELLTVLEHELDESLFIGRQHVREPHPNG